MRFVSHSLDWINKLYDDSMLEYDQSLIDRLKADPKRTVVFPDAADQEAARVAFEPVIQSWIAKRPQNAELYKAATGEIEQIARRSRPRMLRQRKHASTFSDPNDLRRRPDRLIGLAAMTLATASCAGLPISRSMVSVICAGTRFNGGGLRHSSGTIERSNITIRPQRTGTSSRPQPDHSRRGSRWPGANAW